MKVLIGITWDYIVILVIWGEPLGLAHWVLWRYQSELQVIGRKKWGYQVTEPLLGRLKARVVTDATLWLIVFASEMEVLISIMVLGVLEARSCRTGCSNWTVITQGPLLVGNSRVRKRILDTRKWERRGQKQTHIIKIACFPTVTYTSSQIS